MPSPSEEILIVDDNPDNLRLLAELLGNRGLHLCFATSGARALDSIALNPPDLLLLDIRMPEMDGYEVCRRVKENAATRDIPVIFISALDELGDKVHAFGVGGVDYVTKPFQMEEVLARVQTHLALRRLQKHLQESNARMEQELELARRVQAGFLPRRLPDLPDWQIAVSLIPARTTSGDFYDVIPLPDGGVGVAIGDVADKGVGAALLMAMSCALLRTFLSEHPREPDAVLGTLNRQLMEYTALSQFVTAFLGIVDPASGRLVYASAGHNPPLSIGAAQVQHLAPSGTALAVLRDATFESRSITLERGDRLVLYTDGVTEATNAQEELFGVERLEQIVRASYPKTAEEIRDDSLDAVYRFSGGAALADDLALVILARNRVTE